MRKWMLAAGAAALAVAGPALADPNKGGKGGGKAEHAQHAKQGGGGKAAKADRGGGGQVKAAKVRDDRAKPKGMDVDNRRAVKVDRDKDRAVARDRRDDIRVVRADRDDGDALIRRAFDRDLFAGRGRGLIAGCPPGLDKKDNGCMPPGQAKKLVGSVLPLGLRSSLLPATHRSWFRDDDDYMFRAGDGFIYRVDRDDFRIAGLMPLATSGGYYALGDPWPQPYNFYNVPYQYRSFYPDNNDDCYRYDGFGAIYGVDCNRGVVDSIVALLAGDLGVGSRLPMGYDVYNVPLAYRGQYMDTPTSWYRYNDGYVYQVDPTTRLITAVINALV